LLQSNICRPPLSLLLNNQADQRGDFRRARECSNFRTALWIASASARIDGPVSSIMMMMMKTITDVYDRVSEDVAHHKMVAETVGIGFAIPATALSVLKFEESEVAVTA
jgi:hypothetical protein